MNQAVVNNLRTNRSQVPERAKGEFMPATGNPASASIAPIRFLASSTPKNELSQIPWHPSDGRIISVFLLDKSARQARH